MNISNLFKSKKAVFSLEVFPPKMTSSLETIYNTLFDIRKVSADFISVTYGAGGDIVQNEKTIEISSLIKTEYKIEPIAHLTCINARKEDIIRRLDKLKRNDITNILALRGDRPDNSVPTGDFKYASDLVKFISEYDSRFNISGACYPECHCECDNIKKDIKNLGIKVQNGAAHLISQLFFSNESFYKFREKATASGINVPIQAGIMPITSKAQIEKMVSLCGASLPNKLTTIINRYSNSPHALRDAGISFATEQIIDLLANDARGIHLYTMNNTYVATKISENTRSIFESING